MGWAATTRAPGLPFSSFFQVWCQAPTRTVSSRDGKDWLVRCLLPAGEYLWPQAGPSHLAAPVPSQLPLPVSLTRGGGWVVTKRW